MPLAVPPFAQTSPPPPRPPPSNRTKCKCCCSTVDELTGSEFALPFLPSPVKCQLPGRLALAGKLPQLPTGRNQKPPPPPFPVVRPKRSYSMKTYPRRNVSHDFQRVQKVQVVSKLQLICRCFAPSEPQRITPVILFRAMQSLRLRVKEPPHAMRCTLCC